MPQILRLFAFWLIFFPALLSGQQQKISKRTPLPAVLEEISGMTILPNGDLWLLNDSHNPPDLFKFDLGGQKILKTIHLPVPNIDWEDLTSDSLGNLYIGDFGNNYNRRQDLRILLYNPDTGILDSILFEYIDQTSFPPARKEEWNYNCEAFIFFKDSLHLFSKNTFKGNFFTKHYVIPAKPGHYTAALRDSVLLKNRVVTGAAISRDKKTLALTGYIVGKKWGFLPFTHASAMLFTGFRGSQFWGGQQRWQSLPKFLFAKQFESITPWNDVQWLVANEKRRPQHQSIWRIRGGRN
jgi:hypothetical protein